jgi:phosphate acetyltransferase
MEVTGTMEKKIFIASTEQRSGKSLVTIGLINALQAMIPTVGYMKPVGHVKTDGGIDRDAFLVKAIFNLTDDEANINPATMSDALQDKEQLFERIFDAYGAIARGKDVVVIEGTDYTSTIAALEFDINAEIAQNLGAPVLLVAKGAGKTVEEIVQSVSECAESFNSMGCDLIGVVVNRFDPLNSAANMKRLGDLLKREHIPLFGTILNNPLLSGPRLRQVAESLDAEVVYKGDDLTKVVTDVKVLAMNPENALEYMRDKEGCLLITPGDRLDLIFTAMIAQRSYQYPRFSGVILTGGLLPGENARKLLDGIADAGLTVLSVKDDTYTTAMAVNRISGELTADDREKIELAKQAVERDVDVNSIHMKLGAVSKQVTTPRMFQYRLFEMAKAARKYIVLPEGKEPRILQATEELLRREICNVCLLGDEEEILEKARSLGVGIEGAKIVDMKCVNGGPLDSYAETYYQLRKHKGVTHEMARDQMLDPVYYATMMVYMDHADGFVSGSTHSTAETLGPVLRIIRARKDISIASSIFFMLMPEKAVVYGDCALVENPNAEQLADIAVTSAETAKAFGVDPYVAMLSYSTGTSGKGRDVDKVKEATLIAQKKRPDLPIEGPIQYDAATSTEVARVKLSDSKVAGKATVYIFPDLDAGNTAYKAVQRSANVPAIGPIVQGLNKPANDLSRGATVTDIIYTVAVTAIQAQKKISI